MADSRRSRPAERAAGAAAVRAAVAATLAEHVARDARIAVALSGGRDSVALLAATCAERPGAVTAIHVHHGLSAHADAWADFCGELAASLGVALVVERVRVAAGDRRGIEAAARDARYAALGAAARARRASAILLAHHQDDQAETLLLQLGRGAGPAGLAAMPRCRHDRDGVAWLRPLLDVRRGDIEAFLGEQRLRHVDDDSNDSLRHRRNAVRATLAPAFAATLPGYPATLARAAAHQWDAVRLADDLAAIDAQALVREASLEQDGLARLAPYRARNLLRHFLQSHGLRAASAARLDAMLQQLQRSAGDARVSLRHDGVEVGIHCGRIVVHDPPPPPYEVRWRGEPRLVLPHGELHFVRAVGEGLACDALAGRELIVRPRRGGERLRLAVDRPRRALKAWLQEARIAPWQRRSLPLLFCEETLAAVPGLGIDPEFACRDRAAGLRVDWIPVSGR